MKLIYGVHIATKFIAACASIAGSKALFVINLSKNASRRPQSELGQRREFGRRSEISWQREAGQQREYRWQSEFGVGSKPAGRRLRPQFRGLRSEAQAVAVVGFLGVIGIFAGVVV